jgi:hypothetical protein
MVLSQHALGSPFGDSIRGSSTTVAGRLWLITLAWMVAGCLDLHGERAGGTEVREDPGPDAGSNGSPMAVRDETDPGYTARQTRSRLDPNAVYLAGTLVEGSCGRTAIAKVETPNEALVGFECHDRPAKIDPGTGHLLYWRDKQLREFRCDNGCDFWSDDQRYPSNPASNDPVISLSVCGGDKLANRVEIAPDGFRLFRCGDIEWRDEDGGLVYLGALDVLGPERIGLVGNSAIDLTSGRFLGALPGDPESVRATETGFLALIHKTTIEDPPGVMRGVRAAEWIPELWELSLDGRAQRLGSFPKASQDRVRIVGGILDGSGRLYMQSSTDAGLTDIVERLAITGERNVVYSEANDPVVKLHADYLVTAR